MSSKDDLKKYNYKPDRTITILSIFVPVGILVCITLVLVFSTHAQLGTPQQYCYYGSLQNSESVGNFSRDGYSAKVTFNKPETVCDVWAIKSGSVHIAYGYSKNFSKTYHKLDTWINLDCPGKALYYDSPWVGEIKDFNVTFNNKTMNFICPDKSTAIEHDFYEAN